MVRKKEGLASDLEKRIQELENEAKDKDRLLVDVQKDLIAANKTAERDKDLMDQLGAQNIEYENEFAKRDEEMRETQQRLERNDEEIAALKAMVEGAQKSEEEAKDRVAVLQRRLDELED